jgi:hypothetical protein
MIEISHLVGQRKPKYSEKTLPTATFPTINLTLPDLGSNPGRRGEIRLVHGELLLVVLQRCQLVGREMNNKLDSIWKETVISESRVLSWNFPGITERNHENLTQTGEAVAQPRFEPSTHRIEPSVTRKSRITK